MDWWIYKCNSKNDAHQKAYGDWQDYFSNPDRRWGSSDWIPALNKLKQGDMLIAYQTNRNELIGIAQVRQSCEQDTFVYLKPVEKINPVKVRPLKKSDPKVAAIPALQPGPIQTIYKITLSDVQVLLEAAGFSFRVS